MLRIWPNPSHMVTLNTLMLTHTIKIVLQYNGLEYQNDFSAPTQYRFFYVDHGYILTYIMNLQIFNKILGNDSVLVCWFDMECPCIFSKIQFIPRNVPIFSVTMISLTVKSPSICPFKHLSELLFKAGEWGPVDTVCKRVACMHCSHKEHSIMVQVPLQSIWLNRINTKQLPS